VSPEILVAQEFGVIMLHTQPRVVLYGGDESGQFSSVGVVESFGLLVRRKVGEPSHVCEACADENDAKRHSSPGKLSDVSQFA
jgi:hypothetical protein